MHKIEQMVNDIYSALHGCELAALGYDWQRLQESDVRAKAARAEFDGALRALRVAAEYANDNSESDVEQLRDALIRIAIVLKPWRHLHGFENLCGSEQACLEASSIACTALENK